MTGIPIERLVLNILFQHILFEMLVILKTITDSNLCHSKNLRILEENFPCYLLFAEM